MFSFKALELMNWDVWDHIRVPLDEQVVMIAGPNGSGKTTFLDALRVLLGARSLSTSRKLSSYIRGNTKVVVVKAVVTNPLRKGFGRRPFSHRGVFDDEATLACVIQRKSGHWQRRYAILPGDASLEEIREQGKLLTPDEYSRDLEKAQLPRTLLKVLALEQGETSKLCKRSPNQLLEYVLEMQGDKEVMDNYSHAREAYLLSGRELREQENKNVEMRRHLQGLERDAKSYQRYVELAADLDEVKEIKLPAARYKSVAEQLEKVEEQIEDAKKLQGNRDVESATLVGDRENATTQLVELRENIQSKKAEQHTILEEKEGIDGEYRIVRNSVRELEDLRKQFEGEGADTDEVKSEEDLKKDHQNVMLTRARCDVVLARCAEEKRELDEEKGRLSGGTRREPPRWAQAMLEKLKGQRIKGTLVADVVEVVDPKWQVAIESLLGKDRFTILVDEKSSLKARKLAQEMKYPCYVSHFVSYDAIEPNPGTALSQVALSEERVPAWILRPLNEMRLVETVEEGYKLGKETKTITPDGYRQDERGGVFIGVRDLYCGGYAHSGRLFSIDQELDELKKEIASKEKEGKAFERRIRELELAQARGAERVRYEARRGELAGLIVRSDELSEHKRILSQQLMDAMTEVDELNAAILEREKLLGLSEYRSDVLSKEKEGATSVLSSLQAKRNRFREDMQGCEKDLPKSIRTEAAMALQESEGQLVERLRVLEESIEAFPGCRDKAAMEVFEKAQRDFDVQQQILIQRQNEHRKGEAELRRARRSYVRVIEQTLQRYRQNIFSLAERAGVDVEVQAPRLSDDDEVLMKAGIEIRMGFDGKQPMPINHPKLSGGQSVIASLILLMALTMQDESETGGFFILDEPFAHLSVERIDDVTRFLNITRSQFLLTTPTTHNLMVYNPAQLTLNLRKKLASVDYAPVPTFLRR